LDPGEVKGDQSAYCTLIDLLPVANENTIHLCDPCGKHSGWTKDENLEVFPEEGVVVAPR